MNEPNKLDNCYITLNWKGLAKDKVCSLLGPFVTYQEKEVLM
jgi:hypothetical protein